MIKSDNDSWSIKLNGGSHAYGYLLAANEQDKNEQLHGFATILYSLSMLLTTDQGLTDDIVRGINKYMKRKMKESERKAKSVTKEQIMADEALMQSVLDDSLYNSKGYREEFKRDVKDALNEIGSKYAAE